MRNCLVSNLLFCSTLPLHNQISFPPPRPPFPPGSLSWLGLPHGGRVAVRSFHRAVFGFGLCPPRQTGFLSVQHRVPVPRHFPRPPPADRPQVGRTEHSMYSLVLRDRSGPRWAGRNTPCTFGAAARLGGGYGRRLISPRPSGAPSPSMLADDVVDVNGVRWARGSKVSEGGYSSSSHLSGGRASKPTPRKFPKGENFWDSER